MYLLYHKIWKLSSTFFIFFVAPMGDCFLFSFILCIYYNIRIFICQYFFLRFFGIVFSANCFPFLYLITYYIIIFYKKQVVILHKFWDKNLCNFFANFAWQKCQKCGIMEIPRPEDLCSGRQIITYVRQACQVLFEKYKKKARVK